MLEIDIKLLPFQGVTNERALTQGVASLALGYVHHWAFSPSLLNPKLQLLSFPFKMNLGAELLRFVARSAAKVLMPHRGAPTFEILILLLHCLLSRREVLPHSLLCETLRLLSAVLLPPSPFPKIPNT